MSIWGGYGGNFMFIMPIFSGQQVAVKVLNLVRGRKDQMDYLQTLGFDVYGTGIDIEDEMDRLRFADFNLQDNLPFDKSFFEVVICQKLTKHIENPWLLMCKIKYVLKIGGILILITPNIASLMSKKNFISNNRGYFYCF